MAITDKEEFNLNDLLNKLDFSDVINGLNEYFTADETRVRIPRSYVEIKSPDITVLQIVLQPNNPVFQNRFYRFDAEMYLDKLIAWLRTEHGIFYYPGMEAKYAKTERIPPLTERLMDKGALNSLKKLHKRVTGKEPEVDSHTLITDGILDGISNAISVKDAQIVELQTQMRKQGEELRILKSKYKAKESGIEDLKYHITLLEADLKKAKAVNDQLKNSQKSDINQLISDFCAKNYVTPPAPYFSDEESIEYLFSVVDLERKHRAAVGKQMVDDYEKDLLKFIYKEYANRTHLSDETITYNPPSVRNTITKIISDYARSRTRVEILEGRIKCIFDKYKTKFTVDDHVINGDPTISFMLDCIGSWVGSSTELKQECDFLKDDLGKEAVVKEFLNRRSKTRAKLGTIEKKLEDLLKDVKEELQ